MGAVAAIGGVLSSKRREEGSKGAKTSAANKDIPLKGNADWIRSDLGVYQKRVADLAQRALDF